MSANLPAIEGPDDLAEIRARCKAVPEHEKTAPTRAAMKDIPRLCDALEQAWRDGAGFAVEHRALYAKLDAARAQNAKLREALAEARDGLHDECPPNRCLLACQGATAALAEEPR